MFLPFGGGRPAAAAPSSEAPAEKNDFDQLRKQLDEMQKRLDKMADKG
jgi:hypothetical protein